MATDRDGCYIVDWVTFNRLMFNRQETILFEICVSGQINAIRIDKLYAYVLCQSLTEWLSDRRDGADLVEEPHLQILDLQKPLTSEFTITGSGSSNSNDGLIHVYLLEYNHGDRTYKVIKWAASHAQIQDMVDSAKTLGIF